MWCSLDAIYMILMWCDILRQIFFAQIFTDIVVVVIYLSGLVLWGLQKLWRSRNYHLLMMVIYMSDRETDQLRRGRDEKFKVLKIHLKPVFLGKKWNAWNMAIYDTGPLSIVCIVKLGGWWVRRVQNCKFGE